MRGVGAVLLVCAGIVAPSAQREAGAPPGVELVASPAAVTQAEQSRVEAYWTSTRMRRAGLHGEAGGPPALSVSGSLGALGRRPAADPAPVSTAAPSTLRGPVARAVGRVFYTLRGRDYSCSGSAVASRNRDTVVTAGHCVNAGPGPYVRNWVFVPGYRNGARPHGTWTARRLVAPSGWVRSGRAPDDVGFAVLNTRAGQHLTDVVGALRIGFGQRAGSYVWAFGYPVAAPFSGRRPAWCRGTTRPDPYGTPARGLACSMTGGASGGPWLSGFSAATGTGVVYSVTSFSYRGMNRVVWAPTLGGTAASLYAAAQTW